MRTALLPGKSTCKASNRKNWCFAKIFDREEKRCSRLLDANRRAKSRAFSCAGIFFLSVLVFMHCNNLDPSSILGKSSPSPPSAASDVIAKRWIATETRSHSLDLTMEASSTRHRSALRGLGTVFRRGTKAMSELVVAHLSENTSQEDFRLFLRTLHRSGVTARADVVFLSAISPLPTDILDIIHEEEDCFQKLLLGRINVPSSQHSSSNSSSQIASGPTQASGSAPLYSNASISPFNFNAFRKLGPENDTPAQPLWGVRTGKLSHPIRSDDQEARVVWGSMVGFDASELNPDDALQGFIDRPPMQLRRWACYQMLLGMVRHKFKQVLLTEIGGMGILGDALGMVRRRGGLYMAMEDRTWGAAMADELGMEKLWRNSSSRQLAAGMESRRKGRARRRGRRSSAPAGLYERVYGRSNWSKLEEVEKTKRLVNSGAIAGGIQQIRGLANTMVTEIVKVALERKNRDAFPDNVLLSYLLHKSSVLGKRIVEHLHLLENSDAFVHSLIGSQQRNLFVKKTNRQPYAMVHGSPKSKQWSSVRCLIRSDFCSSPADSVVYSDCAEHFC